jgi:hypothetical protein
MQRMGFIHTLLYSLFIALSDPVSFSFPYLYSTHSLCLSVNGNVTHRHLILSLHFFLQFIGTPPTNIINSIEFVNFIILKYLTCIF